MDSLKNAFDQNSLNETSTPEGNDLVCVENGISYLKSTLNSDTGFQTKISDGEFLKTSEDSALEIFTSIRMYHLVKSIDSDLNMDFLNGHFATLFSDGLPISFVNSKLTCNIIDTIEWISILIETKKIEKEAAVPFVKLILLMFSNGLVKNSTESLKLLTVLLSLTQKLELTEEYEILSEKFIDNLNHVKAENSENCEIIEDLAHNSQNSLVYFLSENLGVFPLKFKKSVQKFVINSLKARLGQNDSPIELSMRIIAACSVSFGRLCDNEFKTLIQTEAEKLIQMQNSNGSFPKASFNSSGKIYIGNQNLSTAFALKALHLNSSFANFLEDVEFCMKSYNQIARYFNKFSPKKFNLKLDSELYLIIVVDYLINRAADTIEDDTSIPLQTRAEYLKVFPQVLKDLKSDFPSDIGTTMKLGWRDHSNYEAELLQDFNKVLNVYSTFPGEIQTIIYDQIKMMTEGMIEFLFKEVLTFEDFDLYCHYIAGEIINSLVKCGKVLSKKIIEFSDAELEKCANHFGNFVITFGTVIDIYEDLTQEGNARNYIPKVLWGKHFNSVQEILLPENCEKGLLVVNDLIRHGFENLPYILGFLNMMKDSPQFRGIGCIFLLINLTLVKCYNNPDVFKKTVELKKSKRNQILLNCHSYDYVIKNMKFLPPI